MTGQTFRSVWGAIENTPGEAENMKLRSALARALRKHIETHDWNQADAAKAFHVTQPRISDLLRGKVSLFGLEALIGIAVAAGLRIELRIAGTA